MKIKLRHWVVVAILAFVTANSNAALIFQDVTLEGNKIGQLQFDSDAVYSDLLFAFEDPFFDLSFEIDGIMQTASDDINFNFGPVFFFDIADFSKGVIGMSFVSRDFEITGTTILNDAAMWIGNIKIGAPKEVPEPSSIILLLCAMVAILFSYRPKTKKSLSLP